MHLKAGRLAFKVTLIYVIVAGGWIPFSDEPVLKMLVRDPDGHVHLSIVKAWCLVAITGILLHQLLWRILERWEQETEQRRRAEVAHQEAEEKLRLVMEASADGLWDWNLQTGIADLNPRCWEIIGHPAGAAVADMDFLKRLVHPADWPGVKLVLDEHLAGGSSQCVCEFRAMGKDGAVKWNWLRGKVVARTADGKPLRMVGTNSDITERKRAEEVHARLVTAVEQAAESIVITDTRGMIVYANPAFEKTSGYACAEVLGQNPRILKSGKQDAGFYRRIWEILKCGESWSGHFINRRKDGIFYEEEATITPVRDTAGNIVNYVAVKRDVTREVQLEAQFRQSQKMEAIGQLAGGVAHDFNNILAVIQLQAGLLKEEPGLSSQQLESAGDIEKAAQRAANLIRQLLLFSRKQALHLREMELNETVTGITKLLQRVLGEQIQMQFKLATQPLLTHADTSMLDQMLINLAVNARDAMPTGGQLIIETSAVEFDEATASQTSQARPGSFVRVSVSDTGCGIPPEILPRIFEPFFTTKDVGKGSGLGLATVFGVVQQHQGWINVYSETDRGTTFRIYLPRLFKASGKKVNHVALDTMPGGTETILLVEDDPTLRANVRGVLARLGYRVLEAAHGKAAVEVWQEHRHEIRLLLTDMVMPGGMTGVDLGGELLKLNPELKVIYASGYSADVASNECPMEEGVNFLTKPFEVKKLAQIIRHRLDKS
jgi:PAS domain S-box-containing protein